MGYSKTFCIPEAKGLRSDLNLVILVILVMLVLVTENNIPHDKVILPLLCSS